MGERYDLSAEASLRAALRTYAEMFDRRSYWDAHELLEEHWQKDRHAVTQGLIQVAAAFVHIEAGRWSGASRVLLRGLTRLDVAPSVYGGLDVARLRSRLRPILAHLDRVTTGVDLRFEDEFRLKVTDCFRESRAGT